jgi:hypothetical protein
MVKRVLLLLLVFATAFQLAGGYALAATLSGTFTAKVTPADTGQTTVAAKKYSLFHYLNQLASEEKEEKEGFDYYPDLTVLSQPFYAFRPLFSLRNKHFLIHYAASIKGKLPTRYLLLQVFRL